MTVTIVILVHMGRTVDTVVVRSITTIIIGNSSSFNYENMMINPRGYRSKYPLIK